ncbi:type ISP restriction/modification enzyme [Cylindrospermopsis raciborskii]|uniref:type ISP restriction/modification enzyme n=1 Tax=Cylindrospermopsis raciborskii TaxID=77022 RepID=UPI003879E547
MQRQFSEVKPKSEFYLLIPQDTSLFTEYEHCLKITDVMPVNSVGIVTARDKLTIQDSPEEVWNIVTDFVNLGIEEAREKYSLGEDARDWKVDLAQDDLRNNIKDNNIIPILYRPFDTKFTYYTGKSRGFICMPRPEVMRNMLLGKNLGIVFQRGYSTGSIPNLPQVTIVIIDQGTSYPGNRALSYLAPLYLYPDKNNPKELQQEKRANFSEDFLKKIEINLGYLPTPETIFYYIYSIFHSPTYRTRYAEFLKIDFPRVPITSDKNLFSQLAKYGEELVALHLMKSPRLNNLITQFTENGGHGIVDPAHPKYTQSTVVINKKGDKFVGVPEPVWNFYIGGYQVCQKWLKDRKGRTLNDNDIQHYQRIIVALQETIKLMQSIDETILNWPIQ